MDDDNRIELFPPKAFSSFFSVISNKMDDDLI